MQAIGRGGHVTAAAVGYSFGHLLLDDYALPWEASARHWTYPTSVARPARVIIGASDGASDYGNKFGEPVLTGWARSFGQVIDGHRREYVKVGV